MGSHCLDVSQVAKCSALCRSGSNGRALELQDLHFKSTRTKIEYLFARNHDGLYAQIIFASFHSVSSKLSSFIETLATQYKIIVD